MILSLAEGILCLTDGRFAAGATFGVPLLAHTYQLVGMSSSGNAQAT
jgi:hypothetical protein